MLNILKQNNAEHILDITTPSQIVNDGKVSLDDAIKQVNPVVVDIIRICKEGYGTYLEVAYEWTYSEAMDVLEVLEIIEENEERAKQAQESARPR